MTLSAVENNVFNFSTISQILSSLKTYHFLVRSPGLVVMGGDAYSKGRGFDSRRRILDGHNNFSHILF